MWWVLTTVHSASLDKRIVGASDFRAIPNGAPGIKHRHVLMYAQGVHEGHISLPKYVDLTATTPAATFGMYPRKGSLTPGSDADIVILNPAGQTTISARTQNMNVDYSLWEGIIYRPGPHRDRLPTHRRNLLLETVLSSREKGLPAASLPNWPLTLDS